MTDHRWEVIDLDCDPEEVHVYRGKWSSYTPDDSIVQHVAEDFAEQQWADDDYPDEWNLAVRFGDGPWWPVCVVAEPTVVFRASVRGEGPP